MNTTDLQKLGIQAIGSGMAAVRERVPEDYVLFQLRRNSIAGLAAAIVGSEIGREIIPREDTVYTPVQEGEFYWDERGDGLPVRTPSCMEGVQQFTWNDTVYYLVSRWDYPIVEIMGVMPAKFIAGPSVDSVLDLLEWAQSYKPLVIPGSVYEFSGGIWTLNLELRESILRHTWDSLFLPDETKSDLRTSAEQFFQGGNGMYDRLSLPYRRGFLLVGPPGNGKSLAAKVLASRMGVHFLRVRSLVSTCGDSPESVVDAVFSQANKVAPAVLCFEDVDSMLYPEVRASFLNALDGFSTSKGVLVVATTNNPDKIDPALLNRPARFDRKWVFGLPGKRLRRDYLESRTCALVARGLSPLEAETVRSIADGCGRYSFAMIQELVVTAGFEMAHTPSTELVTALQHAHTLTKRQLRLGDLDEVSRAEATNGSMGFRTEVEV